MDIDEFKKNTVPRAKKSKLDPYLLEIRLLKKEGYSNLQIKDWLEANKILVSQEAVRKFIKSREGKEPQVSKIKSSSGSTEKPAGSNPLHGLSKKREEGEFNPIPKAKIEFE